MKNITTKNPEEILRLFREEENVQLKTKKGFINKIGDILSKTEGSRTFIANKGRWIEW